MKPPAAGRKQCPVGLLIHGAAHQCAYLCSCDVRAVASQRPTTVVAESADIVYAVLRRAGKGKRFTHERNTNANASVAIY